MTEPRPTFTYLGHSTVRVDFADGGRWLIDPWVRGNPACPPQLHDLERLDALLITHAHADHFADAVEIATRYEPKRVVANFEICRWLEEQGVANTAPMNLGGSQDVLGHRVTMARADHSSGLEDGGRQLDGGTAAGFVVRTADGFSFYHAGDTALFSDMKLIASLYRPRLGFVPIGDLFTMGPSEAALGRPLQTILAEAPLARRMIGRLGPDTSRESTAPPRSRTTSGGRREAPPKELM